MIALVTGLLFVGYTLVYAAVANGGKLATRPWDALRMDAYGESAPTSGASSGSGSGGGGSSTLDKVAGVGVKVAETIGGFFLP